MKLDLYSVFEDEPPVLIIFGGNTKQNKEKIKELGADWTHEYPSEGDFMNTRKSGFRWVIRCNTNEIGTKLLEIKKIGAKINNLPSKTDISSYLHTLKEYETVKRKYHLAIEELGAIPSWSSEINDIWPEEARWNGKFYGKSGKWCVYLSNEKIDLTDEQNKSMEETMNQRNLWKKKKNEIDKKYKKFIR